MPDVNDADPLDPFDRALRLEDEIRARVESGELDADEAAALRDLAGESAAEGLRLTIDQAARVVEEGIDPAVLVELVRALPRVDVDEAIDLIESYAPERSSIASLVEAGLSDLRARDVEELWDNDLDPATVRLASELGIGSGSAPESVGSVVDLAQHLDDVHGTLRELAALGLSGLTVAQICDLADHDVSPATLQAMLDANPGLTVDDVIDIAASGLDADAVADFAAKGITIDALRAGGRPSSSSSAGIHLNFPSGGKRVVLGVGVQTIRRDETVTGFFVGNVTILEGVTAVIEATIVGDVHVLAGATLVLRGRVIGNVRNRGGTVTRGSAFVAG
jgi:hypothetical protein